MCWGSTWGSSYFGRLPYRFISIYNDCVVCGVSTSAQGQNADEEDKEPLVPSREESMDMSYSLHSLRGVIYRGLYREFCRGD